MSITDQFISDYDGKKNVSFDGIPENAGQCVQSVGFYVRDYLHLPVYYSDAANWFTNFDRSPLPGAFTKIPNNPNDANQVPATGDIMIWNGSLPNSGGAGHIAIFLNASAGGFISFDSNWGGKYCHKVTHNWTYVLGWLHPNINSAPAQGDTNVIMQDGDNWFARFDKTMYQIRGRHASRAEYTPFIGVDSLHMLEAISDNAEADTATQAQELGQLASKDNWQGQIYGLEDQLKASKAISDQLNVTLAGIQADDKATKADMAAAIARASELTAQLQAANDKLAELQKTPLVVPVSTPVAPVPSAATPAPAPKSYAVVTMQPNSIRTALANYLSKIFKR